MGASGWEYYVPYEADTNAALEKLRQQVFNSGEYYKAEYGDWRNMTEKDAIASLYDEMEPEISEIVVDDWRAIKQLAEPTDPNSLLEWNRESGTHSVIDIYRGISDQPDFGTVCPLTSEQLLSFFDTTKPTHEMVAKWLNENGLTLVRRRGQGLYLTIYENEKPTEYLFTGFSGD